MKTTLFAVVLSLLAASLVNAQTASSSSQSDQPLDPTLGISTLQFWPSGAPEIQGTPAADLPTLTVFLPQEGKGTGSAVIVAPGGAYSNLSSNLEGRQVADWFTSQGVTAFVLKYRLGAKYLYPIPLQDAQRAVRLVRSLAATYGFSPTVLALLASLPEGIWQRPPARFSTPASPMPATQSNGSAAGLIFWCLAIPG